MSEFVIVVLALLLVIQLAVFYALITKMTSQAAQERSELTRRLIAVSSIDAAQVLDSVEGAPDIKPVHFVDEEGKD